MHPPRTWDEVCDVGGKLTKGNIIGYAVPIGVTGGIGGAQAFGESLLSTLLPGRDGKYFAEDHKTIAFTRESFLKTAQLIKDLFVKCKASTPLTLQYGFQETHDGLRAGTIAMATFGLFRYRAIQQGGLGTISRGLRRQVSPPRTRKRSTGLSWVSTRSPNTKRKPGPS